MLLSTAVTRYFDDHPELSDSLRRQRRWALNNLLEYTKSRGLLQIQEAATAEVLAQWAAHLSEHGRALSSVRSHLSAARILYDYIRTSHPGYVTKLPPLPARLSVTPPRRDLATQLLERLESPAPAGVGAASWARFVAMTHLLASTSMTAQDFAALKVVDVEKPGLIHTGPRSTLPLNETTQESLRIWLTTRSRLLTEVGAPDLGYLWVRVRSTTDREATSHQVGERISLRGLRQAFVSVAVAIAPAGSDLAGIELHDIRGMWL